MNSQGLASWERVRGSPGPARMQAKDRPLGGPASPGIREREGPEHRPHSRLLLEQPRRHPRGMFMGWMDAVTDRVIHTPGWGSALSLAQLGVVPDRNRK